MAWQVEEFMKRISKSLEYEVEIIASPSEFLPGDRILQSVPHWIDSSELILTYCDNYISDEDLRILFDPAKHHKVIVQRRDSGNVRLDESGYARYSAIRSDSKPFVELGFWCLKPHIFLSLLTLHKLLPDALEAYTSCEQVPPLEVENFYSASDLIRYVRQRKQNRKTCFLDRDGVLVKSVGKGEYLRGTDKLEFIPENIEFFKSMSAQFNVDFIVVTNQAGIQRNIVTAEEVELLNQKIALEMLLNEVPIIAFYVCPHHWDTNCECRKPKPGLIVRALEDFEIEPSSSLLIGDRESDLFAGAQAGLQSFLLHEAMPETERCLAYKDVLRFISSI
jgi:D-glycero-D-manno-heptose 1,7-bisphosphate phosphatase